MKALLLSCQQEGCSGTEAEQLCKMMIKALSCAGIEGIFRPLYTKEQLLHDIHSIQPDIVYCADHHITGDPGKRLGIQTILDENQIPYVGSTSETLELVLSKSLLKRKWLAHGVPTPPFVLVDKSRADLQELDTLQQSAGYPFILKPDAEGNSRGVNESSIVFDKNALGRKLEELLHLYETVLVEKYLGIYPDIREFTVAMIGNDPNSLLMPAELTLKQKKKLRIITTEDKENHNTLAVLVNDMDLHTGLISLAKRAFSIAGIKDYSRCDVMYANGQFLAIEVNGQPMIPDKWFQVCASGMGMDQDQYINAIFLAGIVRNIHQGRKNLKIPQKMESLLPRPAFNALMNQL